MFWISKVACPARAWQPARLYLHWLFSFSWFEKEERQWGKEKKKSWFAWCFWLTSYFHRNISYSVSLTLFKSEWRKNPFQLIFFFRKSINILLCLLVLFWFVVSSSKSFCTGFYFLFTFYAVLRFRLWYISLWTMTWLEHTWTLWYDQEICVNSSIVCLQLVLKEELIPQADISYALLRYFSIKTSCFWILPWVS